MIFSDGDVEELQVCVKSDEKWIGKSYVPLQYELDVALSIAPRYQPTNHYPVQCIKNEIDPEVGFIHMVCRSQNLKACEWLCSCFAQCTNWYLIEVGPGETQCYLLQGNPKDHTSVSASGYNR
eukprot:UN27617